MRSNFNIKPLIERIKNKQTTVDIQLKEYNRLLRSLDTEVDNLCNSLRTLNKTIDEFIETMRNANSED